MFAIVAFVIFLLDVVKVQIGDVSMIALGLLFVALHLAVQPIMPGLWPGKR